MKKEKNCIIMDISVYLHTIFILLLSERQHGIVVQELANNLSIVTVLVVPLFKHRGWSRVHI